MAAHTNVFSIYVEVRQQIRAVQAVLRINEPWTNEDSCHQDTHDLPCPKRLSSLQVEIHPNSLNFIISSDGSRHVFPLTPISLLPKTCNGLQWVQDEGLHMRLQLAGTREAGDQREMDEVREKEELDFLWSAACIVTCGTCRGKMVTDPCIFDRVLPLPSENWREMSESWCCHGNEGTRQFASQPLRPSEKDCLVGNLYLLMHPSMLCKDALLLASRNRKQQISNVSEDKKKQTLSLLCRRCRSSVGEAITGGSVCEGQEWPAVHSLKVFKHSIRIQPHMADPSLINVFNCCNTESYLAKYIASVSQMHTTFKFIIENETNRQPYLLIWLLSSDTLLLTSDASPVGCAESRFHGNHQEVSETSHVSRDSIDICCCQSEETTHSVEARRIVKVLYQTSWDEEGNRVLQQWSRDLSVQCTPLPRATCLELMLLLAASNQDTPASLRDMANGFKAGYLRL